MRVDDTVLNKVEGLNELAMAYEVSVQAFSADDYLNGFYDFYEIKDRDHKLIRSPYPFGESLKELSGDDVWQPIADMTLRLFGEPQDIKIFENFEKLTDELEGPDGLAPFFFVFDLMFCEYGGFTLCFISGTNN